MNDDGQPRRSARIANQRGKGKNRMDLDSPIGKKVKGKRKRKKDNIELDDGDGNGGMEKKSNDVNMVREEKEKEKEQEKEKTPVPGPPAPPPPPSPQQRDALIASHPDPVMRAVAKKYLATRARHAAALQLRNLIDGKMRDWSEPQLMKWVRKNLPAAESAVAQMPDYQGKRTMLMMMFEDHHSRIFEMVDELKNNLIVVGFDPALFDDELEMKNDGREKSSEKDEEEVKDDSGREKKDENERNFDGESDLGSDSRYDPDQELGKTARARVRIRAPRAGKTNSNGNGIGNGSSHNGAPDQKSDPAGADSSKKIEELTRLIKARDAENKELMVKLKQLREKDSGNLKMDEKVNDDIEKIMRKRKGKHGVDVSYSGLS